MPDLAVECRHGRRVHDGATLAVLHGLRLRHRSCRQSDAVEGPGEVDRHDLLVVGQIVRRSIAIHRSRRRAYPGAVDEHAKRPHLCCRVNGDLNLSGIRDIGVDVCAAEPGRECLAELVVDVENHHSGPGVGETPRGGRPETGCAACHDG